MSIINKGNISKLLSLFWPRDFHKQVTVFMLLMLCTAFILNAWHSSHLKKKYITESIETAGIALAQSISEQAQAYLLQEDYSQLDALLLQHANFPNVMELSLETFEGLHNSQVVVEDGEATIRLSDSVEDLEQQALMNNRLVVSEPIKFRTRTLGFVKISLNTEHVQKQSRQLLLYSLFYGGIFSGLMLLLISLYFTRVSNIIKDTSIFASTLDRHRGHSLRVRTFASEFEQLGQSLNLVSHKLSEQDKQVQASKDQAEKLALVASKTTNAVIITNANQEIEWVNEGFEQITGYQLSEIMGKKPSEFLQGPDTDEVVTGEIRKKLARRLSCEAEILNYRKDGTAYWANLAIQPIIDDRSVLQNYIAIKTDITERKEAEVELYEAKVEAEKANMAKSEFLSRMSHELRTPLNAILGFAQILQMDDLNEEQDDSVNRILKAGKHLLALINEVLEISRIESGGFALSIESVAIQESVEDVLRLAQPLATEHDINLVCDESLATNYIVLGDLQRINQVLLNLVSNAIKYNRPNGTVTIRSEEQGNGRLRVFVQDTGYGIEEDKLDRLFVPFDRLGAEQTTIEGSGIGLALTKQLLNIMDGTIGVSSVVDEGTTFWFELPISEIKTVEAVNSITTPFIEANPENEDGNPTIVYIEDNLSNVALVERVMDRMGNIDLQVALQGQEGLELVEREHPDLVLLDLHLPLLGGEVILERLKQHDAMKSIPVIILSADATPKHIQRLMDKGADDYLTKPLDVQELADQVHKYLGA